MLQGFSPWVLHLDRRGTGSGIVLGFATSERAGCSLAGRSAIGDLSSGGSQPARYFYLRRRVAAVLRSDLGEAAQHFASADADDRHCDSAQEGIERPCGVGVAPAADFRQRGSERRPVRCQAELRNLEVMFE